MDSLLATYASSDEEDDQQPPPPPPPPPPPLKPNQSKFGAKLSTSLPPPKSQISNPNSSSSSSASLFSKLPQPKSETSDPFNVNPKPRKVVQFHPPVTTKPIDDDDDDDDDEDDIKEQPKKDNTLPQAPSVKSFLSSIPAPRNSGSLGSLPSASGTGRRSILESEVPALSNSNSGKETVSKSSVDQVQYDNNSSNVNYDNSYVEYTNANVSETNVDYANYDYGNYGGYENVVGTDNSSYGPAAPVSDDHVSYSGYEGYSDYTQYESKWVDRSGGNVGPEIPVTDVIQNAARVPGKRGRNEIPQEVIEVSQDELMKNRPREDQVKATGIAFGPAYQPTSSAKGKPTKLHKRKHQIGSLYFDMKSKEMELAERRSKGFLTKAETHAKYGW
ncbi:uncharacterized protein [Rutidosis leptorrhynchoides]|uniref:uncharacterized protein n=1 Tax=Rutidosis leptorrhynchoides TaxID=125765 RepID=UPI003A998B9B